VVLVLGEAGLGKSRLVHTITQLVREAGAFWPAAADSTATMPIDQNGSIIEWRCSQQFQNSELFLVSDFMERSLGFAHDQSPTTRFDLLARHLEEYDLGRPECLGLFVKLLFLPPGERYLAAGLTPTREREETFRILRQWLGAHAAKRPVLFVVEDLHWSDASSLEFLDVFIGEGPHERILTFRPQFKIPWPAAAHQTILALNRLTRRQVTEWVRGDSNERLPDSLVAQIYERTGGVPLLVEEFTKMVRESTVLDLAAEVSTSDRTANVREIPATLQDLVIARLDRMSSNRDIVQLAAVLGREFDYELLAAVVAVEEQSLQAELAKLVSANILYVEGQPPECTYRFKHTLLEEALYGTIDELKRRQFHQQIAEVLETRFTKMVDMPPELLARHFIKAGIVQKAVEYCLKAGLRSRDRFANAEAVSHFTKGLELLEMLYPSPERDARELELLGPLGTAYIAWRGYAAPEVGPVFRRARTLCERGADAPAFRNDVGQFRISYRARRFRDLHRTR
jgi:predicted ATPase